MRAVFPKSNYDVLTVTRLDRLAQSYAIRARVVEPSQDGENDAPMTVAMNSGTMSFPGSLSPSIHI
jgi:hypothetical protein